MATQTPHEILIPPERLKQAPLARHRTAASSNGERPNVDVRGLWARLRRDVEGEVRFDDGSRGLYSQDASNYLHVPLGVVIPKTQHDVSATIAACREFDAPVVSRGGGTALAGQSANEAVLIDFSKYLHRIIWLDPKRRQARVEPGVICDQLVDAAKPHGLTWGPKPATHDHCCFGGMIANNCGGMHAQYAGTALHNVEAMRALLYDGTRLELGWTNERDMKLEAGRPDRVGAIHRALLDFRARHGELIRSRMPQLPRRVSGYNIDELLPGRDGRINLARTLVGSEGTCVTMLEMTLRLVDEYPERAVVVMGFEDIFRVADHVPDVLEFNPLGVEGLDQKLIDHVLQKRMPQQKYVELLPQGKAWLMVELGSHEHAELRARLARLTHKMRALSSPPTSLHCIEARSELEHLRELREAGLGATAFVPGQRDTWPGFEDSAVRPEQFGAYLREVQRLFEKHGYDPALYGHFGMGCLHCRVDFDLQSAAGIANYRSFMEQAADLVAKYQGSLSGEHGDGQARGELLDRIFGPELVQAFREFKAIWDPQGKMNPGRMVDARPLDADLRLGTSYAPSEPATHFRFSEDGGSFAHATLRCVGVGKCRRLNGTPDDDTMCPSFMVTREERHSTRGRAHLLWEMLRADGTSIRHGFRDENVKEALDLCLSCKGCKGDCPVNVDVATYKAEFLSHYYEGRLRPRQAYAFGRIDRWAELASFAPGLVNCVTQTPGISRLAKWLAGMTAERDIPAFAPETFRAWFTKRNGVAAADRERGPERLAPQQRPERVLLWPDTFNNHFYPDTARAAVDVLEQLGFEVVLPTERVCCGRPLYDYGMLEQAKAYLRNTLRVLAPEIARGTPMVVLEPSCASVFRDELPGLFPESEAARRLREQTLLLSEFLVKHGKQRIPQLRRKTIVQGHCHHKSVLRFGDQHEIFRAMQLDAEVLSSGCCGLAGSFGFEADKYEVSQACGERSLLPQVRQADEDTLILADGFSCRTQIQHGSERHALHLAEALQLALEYGEQGPALGSTPEARIVERRELAVKRSMRRAFAGVLLLASAVSAGVYWQSRRRAA